MFFDRWFRRLLAYFYRRTWDPETSADLAAETMAQALLSVRRYRDTGAPARSWLFTIAGHELRKYWRRKRVDDRAQRRLGIDRVAVDDEAIERIESMVDLTPIREELKRALRSLNRTLRDAVYLRVAEGRPYSEVAEALGCSEGAARVRVSRGLASLSEAMKGVAQQ
ncbi:MAG: sigma-70 family RNA polymerase sigma factor [Actinomycetota bacterium]